MECTHFRKGIQRRIRRRPGFLENATFPFKKYKGKSTGGGNLGGFWWLMSEITEHCARGHLSRDRRSAGILLKGYYFPETGWQGPEGAPQALLLFLAARRPPILPHSVSRLCAAPWCLTFLLPGVSLGGTEDFRVKPRPPSPPAAPFRAAAGRREGGGGDLIRKQDGGPGRAWILKFPPPAVISLCVSVKSQHCEKNFASGGNFP